MQKIPVYVICLESMRGRRALTLAPLDGSKIEDELLDALDGIKTEPNCRERVKPSKSLSSKITFSNWFAPREARQVGQLHSTGIRHQS